MRCHTRGFEPSGAEEAGTDVGIAMGAVPPFEGMVRRVARLAGAGLRSFWWPDHLVAFHSRELWSTGGITEFQPDPNAYGDPFVCMAVCAEAAGSGRIGVCVTDAIRRMPATLLQTCMTLDHLAPGRVVMGLGSGEYANYGPYGVEVSSPAARLNEAARQIRRFIEEPGPDEHGAVMGLRPPTGSPGPQVWIAAHGPKSFQTTGRYADGWIPNFLTVEAWHAGRDAVADAATEAGRDPAAITYGLSAQVVLQRDHESAHRLLNHPVLKAFSLLLPSERFEAAGSGHPLVGGGLRHMVATRLGSRQLEAARAVPFDVVHGQMLHGRPEEVAEAIGRYQGLKHVVLWDPVPLVDLSAAKESAGLTVELASRLQRDA